MPVEKGHLTVTGPFEITDVRVLDASMTEVASATHSVSEALDPGIYRVIAQVPGSRNEKLVVVESGKTTTIADFKLDWDSVTPHQWSRSKHEYQTYPARDASKRTHVSFGAAPQARLFLYIRTSGDSRSHLPAFALLDKERKVVALFPEVGEHNLKDGWVALSANLPAGTYQIEQEVKELGPRAQTLFVEDGWETQMFVPWLNEPNFASAVIAMRPVGTGFEPDHFWEYTRVEAALKGLADHKIVLHPGEMQAFLDGKFENPMIGLIGAYAYALSGDPDYDRLGYIAQNLSYLLPHSQDVDLIGLIAKTKGQLPPSLHDQRWPSFDEPPLFGTGTEYLMSLAAHVSELCPYNSWMGRVSMSLVTGSAWTRWDAELKASVALQRLKNELDALFQDSQKRASNFVERLADDLTIARFFGFKKEQVVEALKLLVNRGGAELGKVLATGGLLTPMLDPMVDCYADQIAVRIAPQFQLPQSVVREALKRLLRESIPAKSSV